MASLSIFSFAVFLFSRSIYSKLEGKRKSLFFQTNLVILFLGIFSIFIYTVDNLLIHNQIDMEGDASYYYEGAIEYLKSGEITTHYPLYIKFLGLFLSNGNIVIIRIAQLLVFLVIYGIGCLILRNFSVSDKGFKYYSIFVALNGAYYGTFVVAVRDTLILFFLTLILYAASALLIKSFETKPKSGWVFLHLLILSIGVIGLKELQVPALFIIGTSILLNFILYLLLLRKLSFGRALKIIIPISAVIALFIFIFPFESLMYSINVNFSEKLLLQQQEEITGGRGIEDNPILSFLRFIFGPGLIRPLFPSKYFIVYTNTFAFFNWWGSVSWYLILFLTLPLLLRQPMIFLKNPATAVFLLFFMGWAIMYAMAFGGAGGVRKRIVIYFFYTVFIVISYFSSTISKGIKQYKFFNLRFPISKEILAIIVLLSFGIIHIRGME